MEDDFNIDYGRRTVLLLQHDARTSHDEGHSGKLGVQHARGIFCGKNVFQVPQNKTLMNRWDNWDLESGYHHDIFSVEVKNKKNYTSRRRRRAAAGGVESTQSFSNEELPLRGIAPGKSMGLNVMLNVKEEEYYCSGTESVGFKTLLHMPMAMPELIEYGYGVYPGMETYVSVVPEMVVVDKAIHKFDYHQRQCYLNEDKDLYFFRNYTFLNCFMECASNYTFEVCIM